MSFGRIPLAMSACAALVSAAGILAATPGDIEKAARFSERGFSALESAKIGKARTQFENALKLVPDYPDAHIGLGHVSMTEKRYEDGLWEYQTARDAYPKLAGQLLDIEMRRFQKLRDQIPRLRQELRLVQSGEIRMPESDRRMRVSELEQQIRDIENLPVPDQETTDDPPASVHFFIGNALSRLGRWPLAVESYETAVRTKPDYAQACHNLALAYWRTGQVEEAVTSLDKAEQLGFDVNPQFKMDLRQSYEKAKASSGGQSPD